MLGSVYITIKSIHMLTAALSISLFCFRAVKKLNQPHYSPTGSLRFLPHLNDSVLLACAIYLAVASRQYPFSTDWLTAKLIALVIYIGLGIVVMRLAQTFKQRLAAFVLALLTFGYIVVTALRHNPIPF